MLSVSGPFQPFSDGNFASPAQTAAAPNDYTFNPPKVGEQWLFTGTAGVTGNRSSFTAGNPNVSAGSQVGFLQGSSSISQSFDLSPGDYSISFQAAQRQNVQSSFQAFEVLEDGDLVDLVVPATTGYTSYQTVNFAVNGEGGAWNLGDGWPAGGGPPSHIFPADLAPLVNISFQGLNPRSGNNTAFITGVKINDAATKPDPNEPPVLAQAVTDFNRDGELTYNDMLGLFATVKAEVPPNTTHNGISQGGLTSLEMECLQTIVDNTSLIPEADVSSLASKVVNGDLANFSYQYVNSSGAEVTVPLGNLVAASKANHEQGSSATQVQDLVNKWFLGEDDPIIDTELLSQSGNSSVSYAVASGTLFATGGPSYKDVHQGQEGDCWLLAALAVTANSDPSIIKNMFTDDGTAMENGVEVHVWTVRFYDNGVASYVTVNNDLPTGYGYLAGGKGSFLYANECQSISNSSNVLWVALAEKAYAQLCASWWTAQSAFNAYASLDGGSASTALPIITGTAESSSNPFASASSFAKAISSGTLLTLGTSAGNTALGIAPGHDYAVLGYNASKKTFTLLNPWGWNNTDVFNGVPGGAPGILHLTWAQIVENFTLDGNCKPLSSPDLPVVASGPNLTQIAPVISLGVGTPAPSTGSTTGKNSAAIEGVGTTALLDAAISQLVLPAQSGAGSLDDYGFGWTHIQQ
jgi:hypothetical protein